jgi:hypothetical protein
MPPITRSMYRKAIRRKIPLEVFIEIGQHVILDTLASMCRVSTTWNRLLTIVLYKKAIKVSEAQSTDAMLANPVWRVFIDYQVSTLRRFLYYGLSVTKNDWPCFEISWGKSTPRSLLHIAVQFDLFVHNTTALVSEWNVLKNHNIDTRPIKCLQNKGANVYLDLHDLMDVPMTNLLLHYGADPNISPNQYIIAPILFPILGGMSKIYKSKVNFPEKFTDACVLTLLKAGANVHYKCNTKGAERFNMNHHQPIHYAAVFGNTGVLKMLLDYGADVYAPGPFNRTPLKCAEVHGHTEAANVIRMWISQEEVIKKLQNLHF